MLTGFSIILTALACALCVPVAVFCIEIAAALAARPRVGLSTGVRGPCAVLVPAHDEALLVGATIAALREQLRPADRLLVVADNCSDGTAAAARTAGAEVVERFDPSARGKSYALDFGLRALAFDPPQAVVMVDADCRLSSGGLDTLVSTCLVAGRPVQGCYIIRAAEGSGPSVRIAEFAQIVKNRVRPKGLQALGLPCQLAGSGMAIPWSVASAVDFRNGAIVEDIRLGLDFAAAGHPPLFCPEVDIVSYFPISRSGAAAQRQRWQHGHLGVLVASLRRLPGALLRRDGAEVALLLDLCVPPLTMLAMTLAATAALAAAAFALGASLAPFAIVSVAFAALTAATFAAWRASAGPTFASLGLAAVAVFVRERAQVYGGLVSRRQLQWVRTERDGES